MRKLLAFGLTSLIVMALSMGSAMAHTTKHAQTLRADYGRPHTTLRACGRSQGVIVFANNHTSCATAKYVTNRIVPEDWMIHPRGFRFTQKYYGDGHDNYVARKGAAIILMAAPRNWMGNSMCGGG